MRRGPTLAAAVAGWAVAAAVALPGAATAQAPQMSDVEKLYALVTNRYLSDFDYLRDGILTAEILYVCGQVAPATALADALIARELTLKGDLMRAVDAADLPGAPETGGARRALVTTWLAGFEALDATARAIAIKTIGADPVPAAVCASALATATELVGPPAN